MSEKDKSVEENSLDEELSLNGSGEDSDAVSYTHLTLPTILLV